MYSGLTSWNLVNSCAEHQAQGMKLLCFILACNDILLFTETIEIVHNLQIVVAPLSWKLSQAGLRLNRFCQQPYSRHLSQVISYSHQLEPYLCVKTDKIILSILSFGLDIYFFKKNLFYFIFNKIIINILFLFLIKNSISVNSQLRFYHFFSFFVTAKETFTSVQFTVRYRNIQFNFKYCSWEERERLPQHCDTDENHRF